LSSPFEMLAPAKLVALRAIAPDIAGVYVAVWGELDAVHERDDGVNVPPAPPSEKVIVSVVAEAGVTVTVAATPR